MTRRASKTPKKSRRAVLPDRLAGEKALPSAETTLAPLPPGWRWMRTNEIGLVQLGRQRSPKNRSLRFPTKYLRAANITEDGLDLRDVLDMEFNPTERERYRLRRGDIVLAEASGSASQVGKPAVWNDELPLCCFQNTVIRLRPHSDNSRYLLWLFVHFYRNGVFAKVAGGVGINHLSAAKFSQLLLPIAPPEEQTRIVAEIETQFTRLDAGMAALVRLQSSLQRYRASIFKTAFEGRLVPTEAELARREGRPSETGTELLQHTWSVRDEKTRQAGVAQKAARPTPTSNLSNLPEGWEWTTLESIAEIRGGITKDQKRRPTGRARLVPYLRVANVQRGYLDLAEMKQILATEEEIQELSLLPGDVLFNEGGDRDKLGRGWVWNAELPECIHQNHVFRARLFSPDFHPKFLSWYANSSGQSFFFEQGKHTTNLASISMAKLRRLPVPVPPASEQRRIVSEIDRLLSFANRVEDVGSASLQRAKRLRQAILRGAFGGMPEDSGHGAKNQRTRDEVASPLSSTAKAATTEFQMPTLPGPTASLMQLIEVLRTIGGSAPPDALLTAAGLTDDMEAFFDLLREGVRAGTLSVPVGRTGAITEASDAD